jgi:glycosyltransferase involved in cell wall biosynthesis
MSKIPHIALLIMLKDEEKRLHVTLDSVVGTVQSIVAYDTGSTDNTIKILKEFSEKHNIPLKLKEGTFVNFSTSRNISLDFADTFTNIDYYLLCDVNDELRCGNKLLKYAKEELNIKEHQCYLMCQHWLSGNYDKYFNTRFIKSKSGWRYKGSVHEYMYDTNIDKGLPVTIVHRIPDETIVLYQDRNKDNNKSGPRFLRDKDLLLTDHKKDPTEPRTIFYLAQTFSCLGMVEDSFYYYKLRTEYPGFWEERFHAQLRCGELSEVLKHDWYTSLSFYMKAFEYSIRAEPLIKIAQHYQNNKNWILAHAFAHLACSIEYPKDCILFVDKRAYDYTRWHILGIVAFYANHFDEGKVSCLEALKHSTSPDLDNTNLKFYTDREKQNEAKQLEKSGGKIKHEKEGNKKKGKKK